MINDDLMVINGGSIVLTMWLHFNGALPALYGKLIMYNNNGY